MILAIGGMALQQIELRFFKQTGGAFGRTLAAEDAFLRKLQVGKG